MSCSSARHDTDSGKGDGRSAVRPFGEERRQRNAETGGPRNAARKCLEDAAADMRGDEFSDDDNRKDDEQH
jgi:hypothetical protein